jgi:hypothetical protein
MLRTCELVPSRGLEMSPRAVVKVEIVVPAFPSWILSSMLATQFSENPLLDGQSVTKIWQEDQGPPATSPVTVFF